MRMQIDPAVRQWGETHDPMFGASGDSRFVAASTEPANAVVYCHYVEYPAGCVVRPAVVLHPRPGRACRYASPVIPGVGAVGTPTN